MTMPSLSFSIVPSSDVAAVLDRIDSFAARLGVSDLTRHEVSTLVSELTYNLVKYTPGGSIRIEFDQNQFDISATDSGSGVGMGLQRAFNEGTSTGGSLGLGMSSIVRLADQVRFESSSSGLQVIASKRCL